VHQEVAAKGQAAVAAIAESLRGAQAESVTLPTTLVVRESTAAPRSR
jgi:DNA-binding LacI/PurR family transcriptional regulator